MAFSRKTAADAVPAVLAAHHTHHRRRTLMTIQRTGHRYRDVETGKTLDVWFPRHATFNNRRCLAEKVGLIAGDTVEVRIESLDAPPLSTEDAYLRLHLLSELAVRPNEI